ncbi:MAG: histidinol dehydrogenase, partial [Anaerolineales bacterium]
MSSSQSPIRILDADEARSTVLARKSAEHGEYPESLLASLTGRFGSGATPESAVSIILDSVDREGEAGARRWSKELDGIDPDPLLLSSSALAAAWRRTPPEIQKSLGLAARRIERFHQMQPVESWFADDPGGRLGQRFSPIERVGVYVPGGSAPLPSSLLMSVIPARVAGVSEIIVATPPKADDSILAAAHLCKIDHVLQLGGAQAIGALAFGLEKLPAVDKVVGAGGLFVTLAKKAVFGRVGIDGLAGPTETMVLADDSANPAWVAADLLAQAEHDPLASALLLTPSRQLARSVQEAVGEQLPRLSRRGTIEESLAGQGAIIIVRDLNEAVELANAYAPEHLCLSLKEPARWAKKIRHAGGLFLGDHS